MPVPFNEDNDNKELGAVAFLKIEADDAGYRGALFLINALGEPVEFTYTRLDIPNTFLWRKADVQRHATRKMASSLFSLCRETPRVIFCLAMEINAESFCQDIKLAIPLCAIFPAQPAAPVKKQQTGEDESADELKLTWFPAWPDEGTAEYRLFKKLLSSELLVEPFERAANGLREVYK